VARNSAAAGDMDLPNLAVVLRTALSHVPEERKAAEESLNQVRVFTPPTTILSRKKSLQFGYCLVAGRA